MSGGKGPAFRVKAKFKDGREQRCPMRNGDTVTAQRREVACIWDNDGRLTLRFAPELEPAMVKALGGKAGEAVYFDVYAADETGTGKSRANAKNAADDEDDDF